MESRSSSGSSPPNRSRWWHELTRYHWFVLLVASMGWLFDCLDQQLFIVARAPAMRQLLFGETPTASQEEINKAVTKYGGYATSIFMIGWATGGLIFGVMADRIGRAKTMIITILMYSAFTGLSALSVGFWDFTVYRFLTGLGVGGEFAVGVALVAEVMPDAARPFALGLLQALSTVGNIMAALINIGVGQLVMMDVMSVGNAWRWMFVVGSAPALLAVLIRRRLKEPERWQSVVASGTGPKKAGSYAELFGDPVWRRRAIVGVVLASAGVIGLWGIGFFSYELLRTVMGRRFAAEGLAPAAVESKLTLWVGITSIVQNVAGFFGIYGFGVLTHRIGRRPTFAIAFLGALASTALVFWKFDQLSDVFWMIPLMGFFQFSLFGGYAIYFPELFPTRLRSTGTSFCYNVGRYVAASGPTLLGLLTSKVFVGYEDPMRYAGVAMCATFLIGLATLPFAPETRGQPLPE